MTMTGPHPIGVFDSGVGGLSVLRAIRATLPGEDLVYVADSAAAPYGDRDEDFIATRAAGIVRFLLTQRVRAIVVACNTATVVAVAQLRAWCPVPIVAIEPAIKPAAQATRSGVIGVLATRRTIESQSVARLCALHGGGVRVMLQACPGLVEQVERGALRDEATGALLARYLAPLLSAGADTLVLGCTHYPFLIDTIGEIAGPAVRIIDPAQAVARELVRRLGTGATASADAGRGDAGQDAAAPGLSAPGEERFYTTASTEAVQAVVSALWGRATPVLALDDPAGLSSDR
jgi:glutamate racemase